MPSVSFTPNLQRHLDAPARAVAGATVRAALDAVFAEHPRLRGYILDDQGRLRQHVVVYVGGERVVDPRLEVPVAADAEIMVFQALSGGCGPRVQAPLATIQ